MNAQRIPSIKLSAADETTKRNFEKLTARIGRVPNMPRAMAQSPAALPGLDVSSRGAGEGSID
jgi:hypothetical protein